MSRYQPTLLVHVTWFGDDSACRPFGEALYHHLTRPLDEPLAWGAGIPVFVGTHPNQIDATVVAAKVVAQPAPARFPVVLALLDRRAFDDGAMQRRVLETLVGWKKALPPGCLVIALLDDRWRALALRLPGRHLNRVFPAGGSLLELSVGNRQPSPPMSVTEGAGALSEQLELSPLYRTFVDDVTLELCRLLDPDRIRSGGVRIFISHDPAPEPLTSAPSAAWRARMRSRSFPPPRNGEGGQGGGVPRSGLAGQWGGVPPSGGEVRAPHPESAEVAQRIARYIWEDTTAQAFFDEHTLEVGPHLEDRLDGLQQGAVFLVVRSDRYASRPECQRVLLAAKRHGLPVLTVMCLEEGERRSPAYGGNTQTVVWQPVTGAAAIVSQAMRAWLQHLHFCLEAPGLVKQAGVHLEPVVLSRAPELIDLSRGVIPVDRACLVVHPDPELPVDELLVLRQAAPGLRVATPTGLYRRVLRDGVGAGVQRDGAGKGALPDGAGKGAQPDGAGAGVTRDGAGTGAPLEDLCVALSLSQSPDQDGPEGFTRAHVEDATIHLARSLIAAGTTLAYGGHRHQAGYTRLLIELIDAYNRNGATTAELLRWFRAAHVIEDGTPLIASTRWVRPDNPDSCLMRLDIDPARATPAEKAWFFTDMRRAMAAECDARVCLGGKCLPAGATADGYGGRVPGQIEEAWLMLEQGKPLYIAGGFGGGARLLGQALRAGLDWTPAERAHVEQTLTEPAGPDGSLEERVGLEALLRDRPEAFREALLRARSADFDALCTQFDALRERCAISLPATLEAFYLDLARRGAEILRDDDAALKHNGLTLEENGWLFTSRHPAEIAGLVLRGLSRLRKARASSPLQLRLMYGRLTSAPDVEGYVVGVLQDQPPGGLVKTLDEASGGGLLEAAAGLSAGEARVLALDPARFSGAWLMVVSLGSVMALGTPAAQLEMVTVAARGAVSEATRLGLRSLALLPLGAGLGLPMEELLFALVDGVQEGRKGGGPLERLVLCEADPARYSALEAAWTKLEASDRLSPRVLPPAIEHQAPTASTSAWLHVRRDGEKVRAVLIPPAGNAAVPADERPWPEADILQLISRNGREAPRPALADAHGTEVAERLLALPLRQSLEALREVPLVVVHDPETANIPFELMRIGDWNPALEGGLTRRVAFSGHSFEAAMKRRPRAGVLRTLLIVNPTGDLWGTDDEGQAIREALEALQPAIELTILTGDAAAPEGQATRARIGELLRSGQFDVVHYAGHAEFEPGKPALSGLRCMGGERLIADDLVGLPRPPALVFFNACESGRVRGAARRGASEVVAAATPDGGAAATPDGGRAAAPGVGGAAPPGSLPVGVAVSGVAEQLMRAGVGHFLGSFWEVQDWVAARFATAVYDRLLAGETIGQAVLAGRRQLRDGGGHWYNYILYGHADFQLVVQPAV